MRTQTRVSIGIGLLLALGLVVVLLLVRGDAEKKPVARAETSDSALVRSDSRVVGEKGSSDVTFVEFLDFECEACGAFFPIVEQLRQDYAGRVTFVARYFPLPGHFNSERAARAVESAARQGKFEEMYKKMFETQKSWAEKKQPADDVFRGYAEEIGLDMATYDADYASTEVADRVQKDVDDGTSLDVAGTPTFYIDGKLFEPETVQDFYTTLDKALAG